MIEISKQLDEGVYDKGIFKAVFFAGGPGSGKDFVLHKTVDGLGFQEINSDTALEFLMDKNNLDKKMPDSEKAEREVVRAKAKNITKMRETLALQGRKGIIVNGTGDDPAKIKKIKERLEELGYDTSMIMVNTRDEVSKQRNIERGERGGRSVPEDIRKEKWDSAQAAKSEFEEIFGKNYVEYDNSDDLRKAPPELVKAKEDELLGIFKGMQKFVTAKPGTTKASDWIAKELEKKDTSKAEPTEPESKDGDEEPSKDAKASPEPKDSEAAREAKKLGLIYQGFGRYGVQGKTTHRVVGGQLKQLQTQQEELEMSDNQINERPMTDDEMKKREEIVKSMKKDGGEEGFKKRYGDRWKEVMYATANKQAMKLNNEEIEESAAAGLANKAEKSGVSLSILKKVYARGVAAWNSGHRPGTTPQQWGMARVNSYITKGKGTYYGADKDLHEEQELEEEKLRAVVKDKESGLPKKYVAGLSDATAKARKSHWNNMDKLSDRDPKAYEPAPGDATAKTKESKHTKKYREMFGEDGQNEELTDKQKKIDANKNGKIDGQDLAKLRMRKEENEYDDSGMAYDEMESIKAKAEELCSQLNKMKGQQLPSWLASKITRAEESISTIYDYMMFGMEDEEDNQDDYQGEE
jgi:predicted kinase